jgi:hypothetical protein
MLESTEKKVKRERRDNGLRSRWMDPCRDDETAPGWKKERTEKSQESDGQ